jgi:hypothetical protein
VAQWKINADYAKATKMAMLPNYLNGAILNRSVANLEFCVFGS